MSKKISVVLLFILVAAICAREIELENFKPDPRVKSDNFFDFGTLRLKKIGRNRFSISGDFKLLENCGNEKELLFQVLDKSNKNVIMKTEDKFCDFLKKEKFVWPDVQSKSTFPKGNPCPLPKGNYSLNDYVIEEKRFALSPPNEYTARIVASENGKVLAAADVDCIVKL